MLKVTMKTEVVFNQIGKQNKKTVCFCSFPLLLALTLHVWSDYCTACQVSGPNLSNSFFAAHSSLHPSLLILQDRRGLKYCVKHVYSRPKQFLFQSSIFPKMKSFWYTWLKGTTKLSQQKRWAHYNIGENPRVTTEQRCVCDKNSKHTMK